MVIRTNDQSRVDPRSALSSRRECLKPLSVLLLVWMLAGVGAVGGSMLGNAISRPGLFAGAIVVGAIMAALGAVIAGKLGWLPADSVRAAAIGAVVGFVIAAPFAVANLHTPITPVALTSLAGVGALLGAGMARK
jgi:hypothetical protein